MPSRASEGCCKQSHVTPSLINNTETILDKILDKYYANFQDYSEVTSSHWKTVGKHQTRKVNGKWDLAGIGFGNLISTSPLNRLRCSVQTLLVNRLLRKYRAPESMVEIGHRIEQSTIGYSTTTSPSTS